MAPSAVSSVARAGSNGPVAVVTGAAAAAGDVAEASAAAGSGACVGLLGAAAVAAGCAPQACNATATRSTSVIKRLRFMGSPPEIWMVLYRTPDPIKYN